MYCTLYSVHFQRNKRKSVYLTAYMIILYNLPLVPNNLIVLITYSSMPGHLDYPELAVFTIMPTFY